MRVGGGTSERHEGDCRCGELRLQTSLKNEVLYHLCRRGPLLLGLTEFQNLTSSPILLGSNHLLSGDIH